MRFNLNDLHRGHVSDERIIEVVHQSILNILQFVKVDWHARRHENIKRNADIFIAQLRKELKFNPHVLLHHVKATEVEPLKKYYNTIIFYSKLQNANLKLIELEIKIQFLKKERLQKAFIRYQQRIESLREKAKLSEDNYLMRLNALKQEQLANLIEQQQALQGRILELEAQRDACERAIKAINRYIAISRELHIQEALKYVNEIFFDGKPMFEGNTHEEIENFIRGYVLIDETYHRDLARIDFKRERRMKELIESSQGQNQAQGNGLMFRLNKHKRESDPEIVQLNGERESLVGVRQKKIQQLADANHVKAFGSSVSDEQLASNDKEFKKAKCGKVITEHSRSAFKGQKEINLLDEKLEQEKSVIGNKSSDGFKATLLDNLLSVEGQGVDQEEGLDQGIFEDELDFFSFSLSSDSMVGNSVEDSLDYSANTSLSGKSNNIEFDVDSFTMSDLEVSNAGKVELGLNKNEAKQSFK